ncbi:DUF1016 N-terminal domain-containing protein [Bacteroides heparinolyticus]|uniref:DUF1016 N-terminal domain-containing protein n=1 Tax=Prevotella heparinolytica TaxID=28113 RepID=UPI00359F43E1
MEETGKYSPELYNDVCRIIENTRTRLATTANAEVCLMNWQVGLRIKTEILKDQRAEYGKEVIKNSAKLLTEKYGKGWSFYKLQHCVRSAYIFANIEYLMLEESNIKVAQYYTQLPDNKILNKKLNKAIAIAREAKQQK